jgi:nitrous oxidase accessory protein NosD
MAVRTRSSCIHRGLQPAAWVAAAATLIAMAAPALAAVLDVPGAYPTIQAAVDAARPGDAIEVAAGSYCGATVDKSISLVGRGRPTVQGCAGGPSLSGARIGFYLPGEAGTSGASGTRIEGFVFDGQGVSQTNLEPLALGIFARFANDVAVERNAFEGTVQAITNTAGDRWSITGNRITGLTVFDCSGSLCQGGDGIVVQIARAAIAAPGGPAAAVNRPERNVIVDNQIEGAIPDGFGAFALAGVFVLAADDTFIAGNRVSIPDNSRASADGDGVLVSNACCGDPAIVPGARNTVIVGNDGRESRFSVFVGGTGGANTDGLVVFGNPGAVMIEGQTSGGSSLSPDAVSRGSRSAMF